MVGAARIERNLEKHDQLSIISSNPEQLSVLGATIIDDEPNTGEPDPQDRHTSGQFMAQSPSGINYVAGRVNQRTNEGSVNQSVILFRFENGDHQPSVRAELTGNGFDRVTAIAIAPNTDVIIAGHTTSSNFPGFALNSAVIDQHNSKLFVARYSPELKLLSSSILSGEGHILAQDLLVDPDGLIYLTGSTNANDFPTSSNAWSKHLHPAEKPLVVDYGADSFIIALDPTLKTIVSSTLIGGSRDDYAYQLATDSKGNIIVAGNTGSVDFPKTLNTQTSNVLAPKFSNIFVSVLSPDLSVLIDSTVWGGPTSDYLGAMHTTDDGKIHLCGDTTSGYFPVTTDSGTSGMKGGQYEAWYAQLDENLTQVERATFLGGANNDFCNAITVLDDYSVYMALDTNSPELMGENPLLPGNRVQGGLIVRLPGQRSTTQKYQAVEILAALRSSSYTSIRDIFTNGSSIWLTGASDAGASEQFTSIGKATPNRSRLFFVQLGP